MSRTPIFSHQETVRHTQRVARLSPQSLVAATTVDGRFTPAFDQFLGQYPRAEVGQKTYNFDVPAGLTYDGATAITLPPSSAGGHVSVLKQPSIGATGSQALTLQYTMPPGGVVRFRVRAYGQPIVDPSAGNTTPSYEVLYAKDLQSVERLASLMQSKKRIILAIQGDDALKLHSTGLFNGEEWKLKQGPFGMPVIQINPTWEWVAILGILAGAAVALSVVILLDRMIQEGYKYGYRIEVKQIALGTISVGDFQLEVGLPTLAFVLEPSV